MADSTYIEPITPETKLKTLSPRKIPRAKSRVDSFGESVKRPPNTTPKANTYNPSISKGFANNQIPPRILPRWRDFTFRIRNCHSNSLFKNKLFKAVIEFLIREKSFKERAGNSLRSQVGLPFLVSVTVIPNGISKSRCKTQVEPIAFRMGKAEREDLGIKPQPP